MNRAKPILLLALLMNLAGQSASADPQEKAPAGTKTTKAQNNNQGELTVTEGSFAVSGQRRTVQERVLATQNLAHRNVAELRLQLGAVKRTAVIRINGADQKGLEVTLTAENAELQLPEPQPWIPLADACVRIVLKAPDGEVLFNERYFVRPNPVNYKGDERKPILDRWEKYPAATARDLAIRTEVNGNNVGIWIDDRFVGQAQVASPGALQLDLPEGVTLAGIETRPLGVESERYVEVNLRGYRRPGAKISGADLKRSVTEVKNGVPFSIAAEGDEIDVGKSRWLGEKRGPEEFADTYYSRSSFDNVEENLLLAIPSDDYARAHLLCVAIPDPQKTPVLTLRLTRFLNDSGDEGGRGDGISDSVVRLQQKDGKWPDGIRQVGTVKVEDAAGKKQEVPLLQVEVPLRSGEIVDVIDDKKIVWGRSGQYLDLELTKELHLQRSLNYSVHSTKPLGKPSSIQVVGLTLERAPIKVRAIPRKTGHIFYPNERPGFDLEMINRNGKPFTGTLGWKITDFYGKTTTGERKVDVPGDTEPRRLALDLPDLGLGWFQAELTLHGADGKTVWEGPTSLAVLAPDTRKAGNESPYCTWWFGSTHIGTKSLDIIGPLFQRLGFRHLSPGGSLDPDGETLAKYNLSWSMYPWYGGSGPLEKNAAKFDAAVAKHPGLKWAVIYHETSFGENKDFPQEFVGKEVPKLTEKQHTAFNNTMNRAVAYSKYIREKYPDVKLVVGNGGFQFAQGLMQNGYPREYVDAWGDEELGQTQPPEGPSTSSQGTLYWLDQYSKKYNYNAGVMTCYEWKGRNTNPGGLTELEQAQYYTRDTLIALAFRAPNIAPGVITDVGDSYYYSRWGSGGLTHRYPLLTPKPSYVAMAVLTQELDQAEFKRSLPTDSPTLFASEFKKGNEWVYAIWIPRGEKKVTVTFDGDPSSPRMTDMNGRSSNPAVNSRQAEMIASASPLYLRSSVPLAGVSSGPTKCELPKQAPAVVSTLGDLADWEVSHEADNELDTAHFDFPRQPGRITAKNVADDEKGQAIELTLEAQPDVPWPITRYVALKPRRPLQIAGQPKSIGVWVKGNSSWGRVFFELEDAKGERFFSIGALDDRWSLGDWKAHTFINFDGWNYISLDLPARHISGYHAPQQSDWRVSGEGVPAYPVRVKRVVVELREKIVQADRVVDVPNKSVRLSGLSVNP